MARTEPQTYRFSPYLILFEWGFTVLGPILFACFTLVACPLALTTRILLVALSLACAAAFQILELRWGGSRTRFDGETIDRSGIRLPLKQIARIEETPTCLVVFRQDGPLPLLLPRDLDLLAALREAANQYGFRCFGRLSPRNLSLWAGLFLSILGLLVGLHSSAHLVYWTYHGDLCVDSITKGKEWAYRGFSNTTVAASGPAAGARIGLGRFTLRLDPTHVRWVDVRQNQRSYRISFNDGTMLVIVDMPPAAGTFLLRAQKSGGWLLNNLWPAGSTPQDTFEAIYALRADQYHLSALPTEVVRLALAMGEKRALPAGEKGYRRIACPYGSALWVRRIATHRQKRRHQVTIFEPDSFNMILMVDGPRASFDEARARTIIGSLRRRELTPPAGLKALGARGLALARQGEAGQALLLLSSALGSSYTPNSEQRLEIYDAWVTAIEKATRSNGTSQSTALRAVRSLSSSPQKDVLLQRLDKLGKKLRPRLQNDGP